jgi:hypothetical protein
MKGEYVPPSMRAKNKLNEEVREEVREEVIDIKNMIDKSGLIGLNRDEGLYIPTVLIKERELNLENEFPVLGDKKRTDDMKSVWGNIENLERIKKEINGIEIKSERIIDIRPEKKLKAVYYDEDMEEIIEKKIVYSRLRRDMDLGLVEYSEDERIYVYKEKNEDARTAFYDPELFDKLLEESEILELELEEDLSDEEYLDDY